MVGRSFLRGVHGVMESCDSSEKMGITRLTDRIGTDRIPENEVITFEARLL